jgi:hypothetical protein
MRHINYINGIYIYIYIYIYMEILPRSIVLEEEEASENLELVECRWKDSLTFPSVYSVIFLIWTLG